MTHAWQRTIARGAVALSVASASLGAAQLPTRRYTVANGLAHEFVRALLMDSRGLLWVGTEVGISRFDGVHFKNYGLADGLPAPFVNTIIETTDGRIWVATNGGGVARFEPAGVDNGGRRRLFTAFKVGPDPRTARVNGLAEDPSGAIWAATDGGLYVRSGRSDAFVLAPVDGQPDDRYYNDVASAPNGDLWLASSVGLIRRTVDGSTMVIRIAPVGRQFVRQVRLDRRGLVWAGGDYGLTLYQPGSPTAAPPHADASAACEQRDGRIALPPLPPSGCRLGPPVIGHSAVRGLAAATNGDMLVAHARGGITRIDSTRATSSIVSPSAAGPDLYSIAIDESGNLWIGAETGLELLVANGFPSWDTRDGLIDTVVHRISEDSDGHLVAQGRRHALHLMIRDRFEVVQPPHLGTVPLSSWGWVFDREDGQGNWWVGTGGGLLRYRLGGCIADLARAPAPTRYTSANGLANDEISQLFVASNGDLWIGHVVIGQPAVTRRRGERFDTVPIEGIARVTTPVAFAEDRSGAIWVALRDGGVARLEDGVFRAKLAQNEPPIGLYLDSQGRLWIGLINGVLRVDDPTAADTRAVRYGQDQGFVGHARVFAEGSDGQLYIGTVAGVVRLNIATGLTHRFSTTDGLGASIVTGAYRDRRGTLWFGTVRGLSRYEGQARPGAAPSTPLVSAVRVAERAQPLSEMGQTEVSGIDVASGTSRLTIEYFALGPAGRDARYEYRLRDDEAWSVPNSERSVTLAGLSPGRYRFAVRSVNTDGVRSPRAATVSFRVLPPIWRQWWFLALAGLALVAAVYALHRFRLRQAIGLERVRARIATDLHDDIGASLSQISILSEVSRQRIRNDPGTAHEPLGLIAETSRELVDKMSDIVWAVNPRRDSLSDLVYRMRRFASDTIGATEIRFRFTAPDSLDGFKLGPDVRRELLLILKESVTNIVKHSRASEASVDLTVVGTRLTLTVSDDGRGFDPGGTFEGNGVYSMRSRVQALGGTLDIRSSPGAGTTVAMSVEG